MGGGQHKLAADVELQLSLRLSAWLRIRHLRRLFAFSRVRIISALNRERLDHFEGPS
jgi:hypothetical protein